MENEGLVFLSLTAGFIVTMALFAFVYFRGLVLIEAFQKHSFDARALLGWVIRERNFEKHATLVILLAYITWSFLEFLVPPIAAPVFFAFLLIAFILGAFRNHKVLGEMTKKPATTGRERKILYLYLVLTAIYFAAVFSAGQEINILLLTWSFVLFFQAPPIFIIAANFVLRPFLKEPA